MVKMYVQCALILLALGGSLAQPDPTRPIVSMQFYDKDYRVLDCGQCFRARGKVCTERDYNSMFKYTRSSNMGNAICCKNGATHEYCQESNDTEHKHTCSMPSFDPDSAKYKSVLTAGNRNY